MSPLPSFSPEVTGLWSLGWHTCEATALSGLLFPPGWLCSQMCSIKFAESLIARARVSALRSSHRPRSRFTRLYAPPLILCNLRS